jgi:hypothetical protein
VVAAPSLTRSGVVLLVAGEVGVQVELASGLRDGGSKNSKGSPLRSEPPGQLQQRSNAVVPRARRLFKTLVWLGAAACPAQDRRVPAAGPG